MPKLGEAGFVLTLREFTFLAALTGAENVYGVEDDTYKLRQEEIQEEWDKVKEQLENKKYIEIDIDGSITVDNDLFEMISHCCRPKIFLKCDGKGIGDKTFSRCYYISREYAVELDEDRLMKNTYALTPMKNINKVIDNIMECYHVNDKYELEDYSFKVTYDEFQELVTLIEESKENAIAKMISIGCTEDKATDFCKAFGNKKKYIMSYLIKISNKKVDGISTFYVLGGDKYLWKTSDITSDKDNIIISISNLDSIKEQVGKQITQIKEIYR
ncbi:hypothetical protein [Vallitalea guaymasensis]|uniref:hypothetical protein n=1 Tax=Vallitalea guaymasensis TaxID=1185412 RepID=UPI00272A3458|nr:hypothetical protein [Vallitalea guaymasensis]